MMNTSLISMLQHMIMETNLNKTSSKRMAWTLKGLILALVYVIAFVAEKSFVMGRDNSTKTIEALKHLRKINKPAIKSIQIPDGDIIDCIDREKQLAFDHPLLKSHKMQEPPEIPSVSIASMNITSLNVDIVQSWHFYGECPEGTIAVKRTSIEDLVQAKTPQHYGKKVEVSSHEYVVATVDGEYYGAQAKINVWAPSVQNDEFSVSQIWVLSGSGDSSSGLNSVEAGWHVDFPLYHDSKTRLFTYWTADGYQKIGCYNLMCPGFVQYTNKVALGSFLEPVSTVSGKDQYILLLLWKDPKSNNWWLAYQLKNELVAVGYWPAELLNLGYATRVQWGGEIQNSQSDGRHTSTQMGSGHFAAEGSHKSSYFRNLMTVDRANIYRDVADFATLATNPTCYSIQKYKDSTTNFYYGGPGRNPNCP